MKHSDSTEMDRLLRRHARRGGETLPARRGASDDAAAEEASSVVHLDADEMNAYAEGALPEAARSRYFAHLADCETCRKLVTDLTLAASRADEGKARIASLATTPSKSWRGWLAAIFSPPVLRYGVPALALFAIITVAIVAMMTQRKESSVAQNEARYSAPSATTTSNSAVENTTATGTGENHSTSNVAPLAEQQSPAQPVAAATPQAKPAPMEGDAPIVSQEGVAKSATTAQTSVTENKSGEFGIAGKRGQEEVAAAPPPPASQSPVLSTPATTAPGNRDKREEPKKAKAAGKDDNDAISVDGTTAGGAIADRAETNEDRKDVGRAATARAAQNQPRQRPSTAAKSGPPSNVAIEKERSAETRSVGGRRFRRQGSAWVDTAYNPSRQTKNVARGSEQYRALMADEPALRPIAEQLGGEVIVVWKSRAYRFY
ncbi:MAG: hypothetical protein QOH25_459 [Acidobacteriota bacterium]|jgi:hypothetical protein|nr:hypothetical protein [Acidobacteriota bacterium]